MDESVLFDNKLAWLRWLEAHHADTQNLWLKIAKKNSGANSVTYAEALDIALCFGWIDGQKRHFMKSQSTDKAMFNRVLSRPPALNNGTGCLT